MGSRGQDIVGEASEQSMGGTLNQTLNQGFGEMGPCPRGSVEEETPETGIVGDGAPRQRERL